MVLKNPTNNDIKAVFRGHELSIPAGTSIRFSAEEASFLRKTFGFLLEDEYETSFSTEEKPQEVEVVAEVVGEVVEVEAAPEAEEAPAKKGRGKKK